MVKRKVENNALLKILKLEKSCPIVTLCSSDERGSKEAQLSKHWYGKKRNQRGKVV